MIVLSIYTCRILTLCIPTGLSHIEQALSITFTYTHALYREIEVQLVPLDSLDLLERP